jgi:hypothetical protein
MLAGEVQFYPLQLHKMHPKPYTGDDGSQISGRVFEPGPLKTAQGSILLRPAWH